MGPLRLPPRPRHRVLAPARGRRDLRAGLRARRDPRHPLLRLGPERPDGAAGRGLQLLERRQRADAPGARLGGLGALRRGGRYRVPLQVRGAGLRRRLAAQGRPDGPLLRGCAAQRLHRLQQPVHLGRRRLAVVPGPEEAARRTHLRLRGAPRLVAAGADLHRAGRAARRVRELAGLHPRGAHAGGRAPLRGLLGLPRHRLLRSGLTLRVAGRVPPPRRRLAPGRDRRHRRLGARPLRHRSLGPAAVRRHRALRARGPAAGLAPRLGLLHLQLRPQRGAELPHLQRLLLVGGVPHRRAADRRGRLDALPGLLPHGGPVGAEQVRRQ